MGIKPHENVVERAASEMMLNGRDDEIEREVYSTVSLHVCPRQRLLQDPRNVWLRRLLQPDDQQIELPVGAHQLRHIFRGHLSPASRTQQASRSSQRGLH
jgi:hypothetical protein